MTMMTLHRKSRNFAPKGFFECEAKGLLWLAESEKVGGPRIVRVDNWGNDYLDIERISSASATAEAAYDFGCALARMHDYGADYFGQAPANYTGPCYFGPLQDPVLMDSSRWNDAIDYFSQGRLLPMVDLGIYRGTLTSADMRMTEQLCDKLSDIMGNASDDKPARIHGDLWSGNVMWTRTTTDGKPMEYTQAVLIDPAAHGGHREEDLAMLSLFGMSYMSHIISGYESVHPLKKGWQDRCILWQLYPIAGHCVFFGGGYVSQYRSMCRQLLDS